MQHHTLQSWCKQVHLSYKIKTADNLWQKCLRAGASQQVKLHHNGHFQRNKKKCGVTCRLCNDDKNLQEIFDNACTVQALEYALTPLVIAIAMFCLKMQWTLIHSHRNMDHSTNFDITCNIFYAILQSVHLSYINSRSMKFWQNRQN